MDKVGVVERAGTRFMRRQAAGSIAWVGNVGLMEVVVLSEPRIGVDAGQFAVARIAAGRVEQDPHDLDVGHVELLEHRADGVGDVEDGSAAGSAGNRSDEKDSERVVAEFKAGGGGGCDDRLGVDRLRDRAANALAGLPCMIDKGEPAKRAQSFGAERFGNVVQPAAAKPRQELVPALAVMLRPAKGDVERFVESQAGAVDAGHFGKVLRIGIDQERLKRGIGASANCCWSSWRR